MDAIRYISRIFRPIIQPIGKRTNWLLFCLCPSTRHWFICKLNSYPTVSNALRRCAGKKLLSPDAKPEETGRLYNAGRYDAKRVVKAVVIHIGSYVMTRPHLKSRCKRLLNHAPLLQQRLLRLLRQEQVPELVVQDYRALGPRGRYIYRMLVDSLAQGEKNNAHRH